MEKRYQVFVSSTYSDLLDERKQVLQALMEMDCIPAGMELFPAIDEQQWEFIKRVIDDCDYYLLIIGGRYGSTTPDGISYTEKEFDYAIQIGLKVTVLVHGSPDEIPFAKSEQNSDLREHLLRFKEKAMTGRLVKFWRTQEELPGLVALSLTKAIKTYPAVGWVRADSIASEEILSEINELRKQNAELQKRLENSEVQLKPAIIDLASLDDTTVFHGTYKTQIIGYQPKTHDFECNISWRKVFSIISPYLIEHPADITVKTKLAEYLRDEATGNKQGYGEKIDEQEFKTLSLQLTAHGLVDIRFLKTDKGGMALFWFLTKKGNQVMIEARVVRKNPIEISHTAGKIGDD